MRISWLQPCSHALTDNNHGSRRRHLRLHHAPCMRLLCELEKGEL